MGQPAGGGADSADCFETGTFTATGQGVALQLRNRFNISVWGTFVATVALERSFNGGTTWLNCSTDATGTANAMSVPTSIVCDEPESSVFYRLNCTSFTSGTVNWRVSK